MKRGDIYWADLVPRSGSEQKGRRPVLIISHNAFNQTPSWHSMIVVPISTSPLQRKRSLTTVSLSKGCGGLKRASVVLCHQVTTLDRSKIRERIGTLPQNFLIEIEHGLKIAMDMEQALLIG